MNRETPEHLQSYNVYLSVRPWPQNDSNQALYKKTSCLLWGSWKHGLALKKEPLRWTSYKFQSFQRSNQYRVFRSTSISFCLKRGKRRKTFWWFIYIKIYKYFFFAKVYVKMQSIIPVLYEAKKIACNDGLLTRWRSAVFVLQRKSEAFAKQLPCFKLRSRGRKSALRDNASH